MSHTFYTTGVVLNKRDAGEYSAFYTIYTREYGKLTVACRGSKKLQSKLAPFLENRDILNIFLVQGRSMCTIIGIDYIERFSRLFSDYKKLLVSSYCMELIDRLIKNNDPDSVLFDILQEILRLIDKKDNGYDLMVHSFTLKVLGGLGLTPQLYGCVRCSEILSPQGNFFSMHDGGLVCSLCKKSFLNNTCIEIADSTIKLLRIVSSNSISDILRMGMNQDIRNQFAHVTQQYFKYHNDCTIQSLRLLALG